MQNPHKTLEIPVEADETHVKSILVSEYEKISDEYERLSASETTTEHEEKIMRRGSLIQELLAQLNNQ